MPSPRHLLRELDALGLDLSKSHTAADIAQARHLAKRPPVVAAPRPPVVDTKPAEVKPPVVTEPKLVPPVAKPPVDPKPEAKKPAEAPKPAAVAEPKQAAVDTKPVDAPKPVAVEPAKPAITATKPVDAKAEEVAADDASKKAKPKADKPQG